MVCATTADSWASATSEVFVARGGVRPVREVLADLLAWYELADGIIEASAEAPTPSAS